MDPLDHFISVLPAVFKVEEEIGEECFEASLVVVVFFVDCVVGKMDELPVFLVDVCEVEFLCCKSH